MLLTPGMDIAGPLVQMWLSLGVGMDTAGYAAKQLLVGWDGNARSPARGGLFASLSVDDDGEGHDQTRVGAGGMFRWYAHRWLVAGGSMELGAQERGGSDRMFVSLDAVVGIPISSDARVGVELTAGVQAETELLILGGEPDRLGSAHAGARLVLRL